VTEQMQGTPREPLEPKFQGDGRDHLVKGLLKSYDRLALGVIGPLWVSLEAPSGWGKTRVAREFYNRLAAHRQDSPHYWPPTILHGDEDTLRHNVGARRKQLHPTFPYARGSLPSFMWWGVGAGVKNGTGPLATDLRQFKTHDAYLSDAWIQRRTFATGVVEEAKAILAGGQSGAEDEVRSRAFAALGIAFPGLALVQRLAGNIIARTTESLDRRARLHFDGTIGDDESDLVTEAFALLSGLATPKLPVVILVEDAHLADESLSQLLGKLMDSSAAVLIITTAYPGELEDNSWIKTAMGSAPQRVIRFTPEDVRRPTPDNFADLFDDNASLRPLNDSDLENIAPFYFPKGGIDKETLRRLVTKYPNPLALETLCSLPQYRRLTTELTLTSDQVQRLPNTIAELHLKHWNELPEATRKAFNLATFGIPDIIYPGGSQPTQWNVGLLLSALQDMHEDVQQGVPAVLSDPTKSYSWVRSVSDALRQFSDPEQMSIAANQDQFNPDEQVAFRRLLSQRVSSMWFSDVVFEIEDELFLSYLTLALHRAGEDISDYALVCSALFLVENLSRFRGDREERIRIAEYALANFVHEAGTPFYNLGISLRKKYARDLCDSGSYPQGAEVWELLVQSLDSEFGSFEEITLEERYDLAGMYAYDAGDAKKAELLCVEVTHGILFAGDGESWGLLGGWYARFTGRMADAAWNDGRLDDALKHYTLAVDVAIECLRANHPWTLDILDSYTSLLADMGRGEECQKWGERRLKWGSIGLDPVSPEAFALRIDFAEVQWLAGFRKGAIEIYEGVLRDQVAAWGRDYDDAIFTFDILTGKYEAFGDVLPCEVYVSMFDPARQEFWRQEEREGTMRLFQRVADELVSNESWDQAIGWYEQMLAFELKTATPEHLELSETRRSLERIRSAHPDASGVGFDGKSKMEG
jgi:hypothetical protein